MAKNTCSNGILGQESNKKTITLALKENIPLLLIGETGTGKTSIVKEVTDSLEMNLVRINLNGQTSTDEFVGKWLIKNNETYWVDGILTTCMRKGYTLLIDEINAALPEILFVLHSLLDDDRKIILVEKDGEIVTPHEKFRIVATCNPSDEYAGTKELNKAFLSRFSCVLHFDYPTRKIEAEVLISRTGISNFDANGLSYFAEKVRKAKKEEDIFFTLSTRELINWAYFLPKLGLKLSFETTVKNKASYDDQVVLDEFYNSIFTEPTSKFFISEAQ